MTPDQLFLFDQDSMPGESAVSFTISRIINGKAQLVCDHWLMPVLIAEWMFGGAAGSEKVLGLENTVRKHGKFNFRILRRDREIICSGKYLELSIPSRLSFTWSESSSPGSEYRISVDFTGRSNKTRLRITVQLPAQLSDQQDRIRRWWLARSKALEEKFNQSIPD